MVPTYLLPQELARPCRAASGTRANHLRLLSELLPLGEARLGGDVSAPLRQMLVKANAAPVCLSSGV